MQSFILDRHTDPSNPVMKVTQDDKIPIYDSKADAQADIANIVDDGIVFTKDTGATEKVVDVVQDGNMNPVTSNAVYDAINDVETVTGTTSTGNGTYVIKRVGKVVTLVVYGMKIAQTGISVVVLSLPIRFRPFRDIKVVGSFGTGALNNGDLVSYSIPRSGTISTYAYNAFDDSTVQLSATWITD